MSLLSQFTVAEVTELQKAVKRNTSSNARRVIGQALIGAIKATTPTAIIDMLAEPKADDPRGIILRGIIPPEEVLSLFGDDLKILGVYHLYVDRSLTDLKFQIIDITVKEGESIK